MKKEFVALPRPRLSLGFILGGLFSWAGFSSTMAATATTNICNQKITVQDNNLPGIAIILNCNPIMIESRQTAIFSGIVTNTGNVVLTNILVLGNLLNSVMATIPSLAPGAVAPYSVTYTNTDAVCSPGRLTNSISASATSVCNSNQLTACTNNCTFKIACPQIRVTKEIARFLGTDDQGNEICSAFGKLAMGVQKDTQIPAFCYRVTVTNCSQIPLTNIVVIDDRYGDLTTNLFDAPNGTLEAGGGVSFIFKAELGGASLPNQVAIMTNAVLVNGMSALSGRAISSQDYAVAEVLPTGLAGEQAYQVDGGTMTNCIRLSDLNEHKVIVYVTLRNLGVVDLMNVTFASDGTNLRNTNLPPMNIAAGSTQTIAVYTNSTYVCTNFMGAIIANANAYALPSSGTIVVHNMDGVAVLTRAELLGCVQCPSLNAAQVNGGGRTSPELFPADAQVARGDQVRAPLRQKF